MTDSEKPGPPMVNIGNLEGSPIVTNYARGGFWSVVEVPGELLSPLKFAGEQFRRSVARALQELEAQRPSLARQIRKKFYSIFEQADRISRIARRQDELLKAIIARLPENLLSGVSIYLDDEVGASLVEREVVSLIESADGVIVDAEDPLVGSWFRRMRALFAMAAASDTGKDAITLSAQAATSRLVNTPNAQNTAALMQNLGPVLTSIERYENVVIRVQALLIVKLNGSLVVHQLTPAQQLTLDRNPDLASLPQQILPALGLAGRAPLEVSTAKEHVAGERPAIQQ